MEHQLTRSIGASKEFSPCIVISHHNLHVFALPITFFKFSSCDDAKCVACDAPFPFNRFFTANFCIVILGTWCQKWPKSNEIALLNAFWCNTTNPPKTANKLSWTMITCAKQSSHAWQLNGGHPLRQCLNETQSNLLSKMMPRTLSLTDTTMSLLNAAFGELTEGVWWWILPMNKDDDKDYNSIACGIGVSWKNLLPLLIHNGLVHAKCQSTVNQCLVFNVVWKNFSQQWS